LQGVEQKDYYIKVTINSNQPITLDFFKKICKEKQKEAGANVSSTWSISQHNLKQYLFKL